MTDFVVWINISVFPFVAMERVHCLCCSIGSGGTLEAFEPDAYLKALKTSESKLWQQSSRFFEKKAAQKTFIYAGPRMFRRQWRAIHLIPTDVDSDSAVSSSCRIWLGMNVFFNTVQADV